MVHDEEQNKSAVHFKHIAWIKRIQNPHLHVLLMSYSQTTSCHDYSVKAEKVSFLAPPAVWIIHSLGLNPVRFFFTSFILTGLSATFILINSFKTKVIYNHCHIRRKLKLRTCSNITIMFILRALLSFEASGFLFATWQCHWHWRWNVTDTGGWKIQGSQMTMPE